mmetsp:Transcript_123977/g.347177  ORF Transcript_123977/g.347177 Transcript_123977/m.347177 type:complete len:220 (+) Transcript_123977:2049-2708(+)
MLPPRTRVQRSLHALRHRHRGRGGAGDRTRRGAGGGAGGEARGARRRPQAAGTRHRREQLVPWLPRGLGDADAGAHAQVTREAARDNDADHPAQDAQLHPALPIGALLRLAAERRRQHADGRLALEHLEGRGGARPLRRLQAPPRVRLGDVRGERQVQGVHHLGDEHLLAEQGGGTGHRLGLQEAAAGGSCASCHRDHRAVQSPGKGDQGGLVGGVRAL